MVTKELSKADLPCADNHRPEDNFLLGALPETTLARLGPHLKFVSLPLGEVLYEPDLQIQYAYFPTDSIISLLCILEDGASAEIALVGREGVLGVSVFMGAARTSTHAVVQSAGGAYRLSREAIKGELHRGGGLMPLILRYTQSLITQMAQTAVCNRHHTVDQQLCRWLLMSIDRLPSNNLQMTQALIANMLGVRREGVTEAAGRLQKRGAIAYSRGKIEVLDREALESMSCACYAIVKKETDRLLDL